MQLRGQELQIAMASFSRECNTTASIHLLFFLHLLTCLWNGKDPVSRNITMKLYTKPLLYTRPSTSALVVYHPSICFSCSSLLTLFFITCLYLWSSFPTRRKCPHCRNLVLFVCIAGEVYTKKYRSQTYHPQEPCFLVFETRSLTVTKWGWTGWPANLRKSPISTFPALFLHPGRCNHSLILYWRKLILRLSLPSLSPELP